MKENVFAGGSPKPIEYRVRLGVTGEALVINLDNKNRKGTSDPVFHLLDNAKTSSKRCDFILFHRVRQRINVDCFKFNSTIILDAVVNQLDASEAWCRALRSTIKHHIGDAKLRYLTRFVLSRHPNPAPYIDAAGKYLQRDYCIRH